MMAGITSQIAKHNDECCFDLDQSWYPRTFELPYIFLQRCQDVEILCNTPTNMIDYKEMFDVDQNNQ